MPYDRVRLGISRCLLGEQVRYDGGHKHDPFLTRTLGEHVEWVAVCPEVEAGMGIPREPIRLEDGASGVRLVAPKSGRDLTEEMLAYARRRAHQLAAADLDGFVLKKDSPSCGMERVRVHPADGVGSPRRDGRGLFAEALEVALPLLPLEEEGRLNDPHLREAFIDRVFAHRRWRDFRGDHPGPGELVAFHTRHKLTLLSHSPDHYRRLGRLVARAGAEDVIDEYGEQFAAAMRVGATRGKQVNVLRHLQGYLREVLDEGDREELDGLIVAYGEGLVPLVVPVTLLRHHFRRHPHEWVGDQTYLAPYPRELMLRNHV